MTAYWTALDSDSELTLWTGEIDRPSVVLRRCDLRPGSRHLWEQITDSAIRDGRP